MELVGYREYHEMDIVALGCISRANPPPMLIWLKRRATEVVVILNKTRTHTTQQSIDNVTTTASLHINKLLPHDEGEYICRARNEVSTAEITTNSTYIRVIG